MALIEESSGMMNGREEREGKLYVLSDGRPEERNAAAAVREKV